MNNHRWLSPTFLAAILCLSLLIIPAATAQTPLHLVCTIPTTCTGVPPNSTTQVVTSAGNPTFQITTQPQSGLGNGQSGTLFLVILVPNPSSLGASFSVNGIAGAAVNAAQWDGGKKDPKLENALSFSVSGTSNPNFAAYQSASAQVLGKSPASFTLYTVNLTTFTQPKKFAPGTPLFTVNTFGMNLPAGTVFYAIVVQGKTSNGTLSGLTAVGTTPLSGALTGSGSPTPTPEPTSMLLLGSGFVCLGGVLRRRLNSKI